MKMIVLLLLSFLMLSNELKLKLFCFHACAVGQL